MKKPTNVSSAQTIYFRPDMLKIAREVAKSESQSLSAYVSSLIHTDLARRGTFPKSLHKNIK